MACALACRRLTHLRKPGCRSVSLVDSRSCSGVAKIVLESARVRAWGPPAVRERLLLRHPTQETLHIPDASDATSTAAIEAAAPPECSIGIAGWALELTGAAEDEIRYVSASDAFEAVTAAAETCRAAAAAEGDLAPGVALEAELASEPGQVVVRARVVPQMARPTASEATTRLVASGAGGVEAAERLAASLSEVLGTHQGSAELHCPEVGALPGIFCALALASPPSGPRLVAVPFVEESWQSEGTRLEERGSWRTPGSRLTFAVVRWSAPDVETTTRPGSED